MQWVEASCKFNAALTVIHHWVHWPPNNQPTFLHQHSNHHHNSNWTCHHNHNCHEWKKYMVLRQISIRVIFCSHVKNKSCRMSWISCDPFEKDAKGVKIRQSWVLMGLKAEHPLNDELDDGHAIWTSTQRHDCHHHDHDHRHRHHYHTFKWWSWWWTWWFWLYPITWWHLQKEEYLVASTFQAKNHGRKSALIATRKFCNKGA